LHGTGFARGSRTTISGFFIQCLFYLLHRNIRITSSHLQPSKKFILSSSRRFARTDWLDSKLVPLTRFLSLFSTALTELLLELKGVANYIVLWFGYNEMKRDSSRKDCLPFCPGSTISNIQKT
jgi:hypothetical protein